MFNFGGFTENKGIALPEYSEIVNGQDRDAGEGSPRDGFVSERLISRTDFGLSVFRGKHVYFVARFEL
jgi:hypothetical protein